MTRSTSSRRRGACAALGAALALTGAASASAAPERADTVFVKVDPSATPFEKAGVGGALDALSSRTLPGGWRAYRLRDDVTLAQARGRLRTATADRAVELDHVVRPFAAPNDPAVTQGDQYGINAISAPAAWDLGPLATTGPIVAVLDTGVQIDHPDLGGAGAAGPHIWSGGGGVHGRHFFLDVNSVLQSDSVVTPASAAEIHGTHVAGIIGAVTGNATGVAGVAGPDSGINPSVSLMTVRFLDPDGTDATAAQSLGYATTNGAKIINASWGGPHSTPLCSSILTAANSALVVVAAGNEASNNDQVLTSPADCHGAGVVSVAATTSTDTLATFSNFGPTTVDMAAPGDNIVSTIPGSAYAFDSGTSMAAPQVSGAAALLLRADPTLTPALLKRILVACGDPLPDLIGKISSGRRLNVANSLAQAISRTAASDTVPPCPFYVQSPADGTTAGTRPAFAWAASDDMKTGVTAYRVLVDNQVVAQTAGATLTTTPSTDLAQGTHTWTVHAVDGAGNVRPASTTRTLVVDSGPPEPFSLLGPPAGKATRSRVPTLGWSATTDTGVGLIGYQLVVDGTGGGLLAPTVLASAPSAPLADGQHTWQVRAYDALNQIRDSEVRGLVVDTVPPRPFKLRRPIDGARIGSRRPSLLWNRPVDAGSGRVTFTILIDGKARAKGVTKTSWRSPKPLRAGRHRWRIRATDAAGNIRTSATGVFVIRR